MDDDEDLRESLAELLRCEGVTVMTAADGQEALEQINCLRPSLMLLDLMMPRMNGWQVIEALRRDPALATLPVCIVSAIPDRAPAGVRVLSKPIDYRALLRVLDQHR